MRIAIGQVALRMGDKDANLASLRAAVHAAAARSADVVVLPECPLVGWLSPAARVAAEPIPGAFTSMLAALARRHQIAVVSGIEEQCAGAVHNAAVLIDRHGRLLARHRKVNELAEGRHVYRAGRSLAAIQLDDTLVGLSICADSWVPAITDTLHLMGARVIFSPCAWAIDPGGEEANLEWIRRQYAARAAGKEIWIVAANSVAHVSEGAWRGKVLHGDSLVIGPGGATVAHGSRARADLVLADLPL